MKKYLRRWNEADINLRYFLIGVLFLGINAGIIQPTFNNYLSDIFNMKEVARGYLEFPRELPGFLLIIVTSVLSGYSIRLWAIMVGFMSGLGVIGLGFLSPTQSMMMIWMVLWNMGDHLFMPVESTMGLYLAKDGKQGKRLGQIAGARNLAMIFGAIAVYICASYYSKEALYSKLYLFAGACAIFSVISFSRVRVHADKKGENRRFVIRKEYSWFYALNVLFGARKQLFLTFAPWVLITEFGTDPGKMAVLMLISSIAGVLFRQVFGIAVDRFGERKVFIADGVVLLFICAGFAYSRNVNILYFLYILDNLMFSTRIARTTYLNKIARDKREIPATISLGITMDHLLSMTAPIFAGILWHALGYSMIFIAASGIAVLGLAIAFMIRIPEEKKNFV